MAAELFCRHVLSSGDKTVELNDFLFGGHGAQNVFGNIVSFCAGVKPRGPYKNKIVMQAIDYLQGIDFPTYKPSTPLQSLRSNIGLRVDQEISSEIVGRMPHLIRDVLDHDPCLAADVQNLLSPFQS